MDNESQLKQENQLLKAQVLVLKSVIGELQDGFSVDDLQYDVKYKRMHRDRAERLLEVVKEIEEKIKTLT